MSISIETRPSLTQAFMARFMISSLDQYYPDISDWYINKVIPGIYTGDDKIVLATERGNVVGIALGKKGEENKLRCIRILPEYQNTGLGIRLMDKLFDEIECENPLATVSEEMIHQYSRILVNRYGFKLTEVNKGLYRRNKLEYCFNQ